MTLLASPDVGVHRGPLLSNKWMLVHANFGADPLPKQ